MIYTDTAGNQYRAVAEMPYSELTPDTHFWDSATKQVCIKGNVQRDYSKLGADMNRRDFAWMIACIRHASVLVLEPID